MSVPRNKKDQQPEKSFGVLDKKQNEARVAAKKNKRNRTLGVIGAIVVVFLVIGSYVVNSNYFYNKATAVSIGDVDYTTAEFNYFYYTVYNNFYNSMGSYASYIIDKDKPLDEQYYTDGETFKDYFTESALNTMLQSTALYNEAVSEGMTLSDEEKTKIQDELSSVDVYASLKDESTEQYLVDMYGKGFNTDTLEKLMNMVTLASDYYQQKMAGFSYTDDELKAEYTQNKDDYDIFTYRVYYIANGDDAEAAYATADAIAEAKDGDEFADLVYENAPEDSKDKYTENESTLYNNAGSSLSSYDYGDWLKESGRSVNETTVIESSSGEGYYVVMFLGRDDNDYNTINVRHILIKVTADDDGNYTQEAKDTAKAEIDEILAEYEAGDKTEESFAALANEKSEDTGSNTNGGLYENVARNQMVKPFEDFCFAEHEYGDTGIVYYEGSNYAGYHLIYYVGEGELYCDYIADSNLRSTDYNAWQDAETANYTVVKHFALRFAD
ncbi:MAG: peptidylprolyl isomerase [Oscillospiraceae bacterium]